MKKYRNTVVKLMAVLILFSLAIPQDSLKEVFAASDDEVENRIFLDLTYDPETQTYSLIGLSDQQLKAFGAPELGEALWTMLSNFDSLSLAINNSQLNLLTDRMQLATIKWDSESREMLYDLIDSYGVEMGETSRERLEVWLDDADVVLNIRNSPNLSDPLVLDLDTLLYVDVAENGRIAVEGFDTGYILEPEYYDMVAAGGVENATICWSKGVLLSEVNGTTLPEITVHQEGLEVIDEALGLELGDMAQYFMSQLGASVSFDGAEHNATECKQP
jgi:hypothetical protein